MPFERDDLGLVMVCDTDGCRVSTRDPSWTGWTTLRSPGRYPRYFCPVHSEVSGGVDD